NVQISAAEEAAHHFFSCSLTPQPRAMSSLLASNNNTTSAVIDYRSPVYTVNFSLCIACGVFSCTLNPILIVLLLQTTYHRNAVCLLINQTAGVCVQSLYIGLKSINALLFAHLHVTMPQGIWCLLAELLIAVPWFASYLNFLLLAIERLLATRLHQS